MPACIECGMRMDRDWPGGKRPACWCSSSPEERSRLQKEQRDYQFNCAIREVKEVHWPVVFHGYLLYEEAKDIWKRIWLAHLRCKVCGQRKREHHCADTWCRCHRSWAEPGCDRSPAGHHFVERVRPSILPSLSRWENLVTRARRLREAGSPKE